VSAVADVKHEIFGPVLRSGALGRRPMAVMQQINALELSHMGIQTRIDSRASNSPLSRTTGGQCLSAT
jgi:RHH-type proline utilization regulon transcriptional repressor/proline dehydrogenase/delta 1-pyrroline-5-carboxylate dehydrogenase